jgi:ubiquinone/menaquinone biosynthesis C-methylase UbiE
MGEKALYDQLGADYDTTRRADPYIAQRLAYHLILERPGNYLDIACGTGNYTSTIAAMGINMTGADQSANMIEQARAKEGPVRWQVADATS